MTELRPDILVRQPILGEENRAQFPVNRIEKEWVSLTERAKRELVGDSKLRKSLLPFCTAVVSEALPSKFVEIIEQIGNIPTSATADRFKTLRNYLALPAIPNEFLQPDLRHAQSLKNINRDIERLRRNGSSEDAIAGWIEKEGKRGSYVNGITADEFRMVARRYRYARDVKLLALAAEIQDQKGLEPVQQGNILEYQFPSGVGAAIASNRETERRDFLQPHLWDKRRQLKDRVYVIEVNGRKYILKEKKTPRHTDTQKQGHIEGLSSEEEFKTASFFQEHGRVDGNRVSISWEVPIGFVSYPDGFQFAVFKYEDRLIGIKEIYKVLQDEIINRRVEFEEEYLSVAARAKRLVTDPRIDASSKIDRNIPVDSLLLTFEDFALVKTYCMIREAENLRRNLLLQHFYDNRDFDGFAFRLHTQEGLKLEAVGFDFEYFEKITEEQRNRRKQIWQDFEADERELRGGTDWDSRIEEAAFLAIMNW